MCDPPIDNGPYNAQDHEAQCLRLNWRITWGEDTTGCEYEEWLEDHLETATGKIKLLQTALNAAVSLLERPYDTQGRKRMTWSPSGYWIDGILQGETTIAKAIIASVTK